MMKTVWNATRLVAPAALSCLAFAAGACAQQANWAGAHVGVFGGYGGGQSSQQDSGLAMTAAGAPAVPAAPPPAPPVVPPGNLPADGRYSLGGGFGGGLVGYDLQFGRFVVGAEAAFAGGDVDGRSGSCGATAHVCGTSINAMADIRGRFGIAYDRLLPFIAGGLAIDHVHAYDQLFGVAGSGWRTGYTIGAGLEYKLTPALSLRLEYLHTMIGASRLFDILPGEPERVAATTESVRVGISYSFNSPLAPSPVIARY